MKKKIVGICICMLMMITAFSAVATTSKQDKSSLDQSIGDRGGLFIQLPNDPGYSLNDWWCYASSVFCNSRYEAYEMFTNVTSPIQSIHWWGMNCIDGDSSYEPGDPVGMTFNITFYRDNNTKPGEIVISYNNVEPSITPTGILYPESPPFEMYFFEYDLTSACNLSEGWIQIFSTGSDYNCSFFWMESSIGNHHAFTHKDGLGWDAPALGFSLVLTDGTNPSLELMTMKGGLGVTLDIKNNGDTAVDNYPVDFLVLGGLLKKITVDAGQNISGLAAGATTSLKTGMFFGLGKITIFAVGDGIASYKHGTQLLVYTIIQE